MDDTSDSIPEVLEFEDDASYAWWRDSHPDAYVLAVRARHAPILHRAQCSDVDRARRPGRLKAKGSRQLCADTKSALRAWAKLEIASDGPLLARCPKCGP
jgi:hypothetical protein